MSVILRMATAIEKLVDAVDSIESRVSALEKLSKNPTCDDSHETPSQSHPSRESHPLVAPIHQKDSRASFHEPPTKGEGC